MANLGDVDRLYLYDRDKNKTGDYKMIVDAKAREDIEELKEHGGGESYAWKYYKVTLTEEAHQVEFPTNKANEVVIDIGTFNGTSATSTYKYMNVKFNDSNVQLTNSNMNVPDALGNRTNINVKTIGNGNVRVTYKANFNKTQTNGITEYGGLGGQSYDNLISDVNEINKVIIYHCQATGTFGVGSEFMLWAKEKV